MTYSPSVWLVVLAAVSGATCDVGRTLSQPYKTTRYSKTATPSSAVPLSSHDEGTPEDVYRTVTPRLTSRTTKGRVRTTTSMYPYSFVTPRSRSEVLRFTCDVQPRSKNRPISVHELRPGDIDVMAAMGDSISTGHGIGAENFMESVPVPERAWSAGYASSFDDGLITLPNILQKFNPDLCASNRTCINAAESGAKAANMPAQAEVLVDALLPDFEQDWKILTILIGGNDLCWYCRRRGDFGVGNFTRHLTETLDILANAVPRMLINLVPMSHIGNIRFFDNGYQCIFVHWLVCPCVMLPDWAEEVRTVQQSYHQAMEDLIDSGRYDGREDFTVVIQPMLVDTDMPKLGNGSYDMSFIAADCFHPSGKLHQQMAVALWNSMFISVKDKPLAYPNFGRETILSCPKDYICTNQNCRSG